VTFAESGEPTKAAYYAKQEPKDAAEFEKWVDEAKSLGAIGTGPSAELTDHGDQSYTDLVKPEMNKLTHDKGLLVHVYTVDEPVDFEKVMKAGVDGIFTNRAAELLKFYKRWPSSSVQDLLNDHKY
jgi:glycerophosphoryl diester phosphodiesterase